MEDALVQVLSKQVVGRGSSSFRHHWVSTTSHWKYSDGVWPLRKPLLGVSLRKFGQQESLLPFEYVNC